MNTLVRTLAPILAALLAAFLVCGRAAAQADAILRDDEHHVTIVIPEGWSRLDQASLDEINTQAAAWGDPNAISFIHGLVPDQQPPTGVAYVLFQWDPRITGTHTPEEIAAMVRTNLAAATTAAAVGATVEAPEFDWPRGRVTFRTVQPTGGTALVTTTVGVVGATGVLWAHCYAPGPDEPGLTPTFRAITDSIAIDHAYAYAPPAPRAPPPPRRTRQTWVAPLVIGLLVAVGVGVWVALRPRA